jgi:hypothetical protein
LTGDPELRTRRAGIVVPRSSLKDRPVEDEEE